MTYAEKPEYINTNSLSWTALTELMKLDERLVGTPSYIGVTYFWAYEYRHYMRGASYANRRLVHKKLLDAGLSVDGETPRHTRIVKRYARPG